MNSRLFLSRFIGIVIQYYLLDIPMGRCDVWHHYLSLLRPCLEAMFFETATVTKAAQAGGESAASIGLPYLRDTVPTKMN